MITTLKELNEMEIGQKEIVQTCYDTCFTACKDEHGYKITVNTQRDINMPYCIFSLEAYIPVGLVNILANERHNDVTGIILCCMAAYNPYISIKDIVTIDKMLGGLLYD